MAETSSRNSRNYFEKKKCYGGYNKNPRQNITAKGIIFLSSATNIVFKASHGVYNVNIDCW